VLCMSHCALGAQRCVERFGCAIKGLVARQL